MTRLRRVAAWLQASALDLAGLAGIACISFGLGQLPAPWGAVLAPVSLGVALILIVRFGGR